MTYELPRTASGEVDTLRVAAALSGCGCETLHMALQAIDVNARAEERDHCIDALDDERALSGDGTDGAYRLDRAILAIHNMDIKS